MSFEEKRINDIKLIICPTASRHKCNTVTTAAVSTVTAPTLSATPLRPPLAAGTVAAAAATGADAGDDLHAKDKKVVGL